MRYCQLIAPEALPDGLLVAEGEDSIIQHAIDLIQRAIDLYGVCWLSVEPVDFDLYIGRVAASPDALRNNMQSLFIAFTSQQLQDALAIEPQPHRPQFNSSVDRSVGDSEQHDEAELLALAPVTFSQTDVTYAFEQIRQTARSTNRDVLWLRTILWLLAEERFYRNQRETALERDLKEILAQRRRLPHLRHQRLVNVAPTYRRSADEEPSSFEFTVGWGLEWSPRSSIFSTAQNVA